ncbi:alpha/beta hydrolase [Alphaproteobacteria bacterium]|nr:alpha/beta hydrolase [Alphaproteobacteria bacterium]
MPFFSRDKMRLHYLDEGKEASGNPDSALLFLHEFGGDTRSWAHQIGFFSQHPVHSRRCLALSARGYPPSDVPEAASHYGWQENLEDAIALIQHLGLKQVDVVGLSMGAYITLLMSLHAPDIIASCVCASIGSGGHPPTRQAFIADAMANADAIASTGKLPATEMAMAPNRIQLLEKNKAAWQAFRDHLSEHPVIGAVHTLAEVQAKRPGLHDFADQVKACDIPTLILCGDEDEPCLDASLWLKRQMPLSGLTIFSRSGHLLNLEDPERFNQAIMEFHTLLAQGKWKRRANTPFTSMFAPSTDP